MFHEDDGRILMKKCVHSLSAHVSSPHPLLLFLCVCKQLPDVGLRLSHVLVENLGAVDNLWLPGLEHLADLSRHQGFTAAWGSVQQDSLHMLAAWRRARNQGERNKSQTEVFSTRNLYTANASTSNKAQTEEF